MGDSQTQFLRASFFFSSPVEAVMACGVDFLSFDFFVLGLTDRAVFLVFCSS